MAFFLAASEMASYWVLPRVFKEKPVHLPFPSVRCPLTISSSEIRGQFFCFAAFCQQRNGQDCFQALAFKHLLALKWPAVFPIYLPTGHGSHPPTPVFHNTLLLMTPHNDPEGGPHPTRSPALPCQTPLRSWRTTAPRAAQESRNPLSALVVGGGWELHPTPTLLSGGVGPHQALPYSPDCAPLLQEVQELAAP